MGAAGWGPPGMRVHCGTAWVGWRMRRMGAEGCPPSSRSPPRPCHCGPPAPPAQRSTVMEPQESSLARSHSIRRRNQRPTLRGPPLIRLCAYSCDSVFHWCPVPTGPPGRPPPVTPAGQHPRSPPPRPCARLPSFLSLFNICIQHRFLVHHH